MNGDVRCFWMTPLDRVRVSLRRFTFGLSNPTVPDDPCPARGGVDGHESGFVVIEANDARVRWIDDQADGTHRMRDLLAPIDERWPLACVHCREELPPTACRQIWPDVLFSGAPDERLYTRRDMPPGAMYDADEYHAFTEWCGPDGRSIVVVLPDGTSWQVDAPPAKGDTGWTRTGEPPLLTVRPSVQTPTYHGYLIEGVLSSV